MKIIEIIKTANSNLKRSFLRTFLTALAISIGAFTLTTSSALTGGFKRYVGSQLGSYDDVNLYRVTKEGADSFPQFSANPKEYNPEKKNINVSDLANTVLGQEDIAKINTVNGVKDLRLPYSFNNEYIQGSTEKKWSAEISSIIPEIPMETTHGIKNAFDFEGDLEGVAISSKYVSALFGENTGSQEALGKKFNIYFKDISGTLISKELIVKAVITPNIFASPVNISESLAKEIAYIQKGDFANRFQQIFISKQESVSDAKLKENMKALKFEAGSFKDLNETINKIIKGVQAGLIFFAGIAILCALVGVINTLYMAVLERTKEVGLFRSIGAKKRTIFAIFSFEAMFIGFWGSIVGISISLIVQTLINNWASNGFLSGVDDYKLLSISIQSLITITISIMLITLLAGILPARRAAKLNPIDALKYE
jgi:putative ABC transport system permease protein